MLRYCAKLSLFTHIFNSFVYFLGDDYLVLTSIVVMITSIFAIFIIWLQSIGESIPESVYYFVIPLYNIMCSSKFGIQTDFLIRSFFAQLLVIMIILLHIQEHENLQRRQRMRARQTGCPGH